MKAAVHYKYGSPDVIEVKDVPKPSPEKNEILVRVKAATVNRTDCALLHAKPFISRFLTGLAKPKKPISGTDFAGEIVAIGTNFNKFKVGDNVFGFNDTIIQSHAEYLTIAEKYPIALLPQNINFKEATASIEGFHYARNFINKVKLEKGQKALINGATGAIGSALAQLLNYHGIEYYATCKTEHAEKIKSRGAICTIDYTKEDFTKLNIQFDYVFDSVGKSSFKTCWPILKPGGIYISSELGKNSENIFYSLFTPLFYRRKVKFPFPSNTHASLKLVSKLLEEGRFKPLIDRTYPLSQIVDAFRYVESGQKAGNVIIVMD